MDTYHPTHQPDEVVPHEQDEGKGAQETEAVATESTAALLQEELEKSKAEAKDWHDRFLRKAAEFENYRKRMEKERLESIHLAKNSVLLEFLPIMDACERALESLNAAQAEHQGLEQYREGVQLLYKQMRDVLNRLGVAPIEAAGKPFDPHVHEALTFEETDEFAEHTVIKELRRGYVYKDRLLRPAQVRVATRPKGAVSSES